MDIRQSLLRMASKTLQQPVSRVLRGMTLGARVAVLDHDQILLVKHTYSQGWILPGGGVERGETLVQAALREIREEAGILGEAPQLHGIFSNEPSFRGDHVACYVVRKFARLDWKPNAEIAEARFFPCKQLPEDVTGGTRRRLAEILDGVPISQMW